VLFFGRIQDYKGLKYLIEASPLISKVIKDVKFVVAGEGNVSPYKTQVKEPNRFSFLNYYLSNDETADIFRKSSVVVLPYIEASQSGVLQIAYAFRKPVVATSVGSNPEYVTDNLTGSLIEPANPKALANSVIALLYDDPNRRKMGEDAFIYITEKFPIATIIHNTLEAYSSTINCKDNR
jgi:alpha-maltose-1-phosphate synthase